MNIPPPQSQTNAVTGQLADPAFAHFVLTRFNVRYVEDPNASSIAVEPAWLENRFGLFEKYCWPSLNAQTQQDFTWLLFFDSATPAAFSQRAIALTTQRPRTHVVFCDQLPLDRVISEVQKNVSGSPDWIITTRMDNDDGLHQEFIATIRDAASFKSTEVLNAPNGVVLSGYKTYIQEHRSNAFISLVEPFISVKTVFSILRHTDANKSYPVRQVSAKPLWLQVIHSNNISNRVKGWRVQSASVSAGFPESALSPVQEETDREIFTENATKGIVRAARDVAISVIKRTASLFNLEVRRTVKSVAARRYRNA